jgi:hypothetical protein
MLQTSDRIAGTEMIPTRNHLHHILEISEVTAHPTGIPIPTAVILDMLVLVQEIGHLPEKEKGSPRTDKVGTGKVGQEKESKVADREGLLKDNQMGTGQGKNQNTEEGHVLSLIPGVIKTTEPQTGQTPQINNAPKFMESPPPQATQMTLVLDLGHRMVKECVVHHKTGPPHSSLRIGTTPEAAKDDQRSNVVKVATGHVLLLKDVRTTLLTEVGLVKRKELQPSQAEAQAETDQGFVHIVAGTSVRWQNAMFLKRKSYLTFHVKCVQSG